MINNEKYINRAEIIREKGTNRTRFYRGEIDKYSWVDIGSSFLPSEFNVSYLYGQLLVADAINEDRLDSWQYYYKNLQRYAEKGIIELPFIPDSCQHNAHMFYIKFPDLRQRSQFIDYMREKGIYCVFHYVPLHSSIGGIKYGRFSGEDKWTTRESDRIVRLPMYYQLKEDKEEVVKRIVEFMK